MPAREGCGAGRALGGLGAGRALAWVVTLAFTALVSRPATAQPQCDRPVVGDHLFSNEPTPVPCVAPPLGHPPIRFGIGLRLGGIDDGGVGGASGRASWGPITNFNIALNELIELGAQAGLVLAPDRGLDVDGDGGDDESDSDTVAILATVGPRLVLRTNAARYEALRFSVDFGALIATSGDARSGPVLEIGIERQVGALFVADGRAIPSHGTGLGFSLGIHLQQGLGEAAEHRAAFLSATTEIEFGAPLPRGPRPRRTRPSIEHIFSANLDAGMSVGARGGSGGSLELGVGFPIGEVLAIEAHGAATVLGRADGGDPTVFYAALGGVRAPRFFPIFVQVLAGYAFGFGTQPLEVGDGAVLDIQAGLQLTDVFGCGVGIFVAAHQRFGLSKDNEGLALIGATLGLRHDSLVGAAKCGP